MKETGKYILCWIYMIVIAAIVTMLCFVSKYVAVFVIVCLSILTIFSVGLIFILSLDYILRKHGKKGIF